jgi:hypothetical protein
MTADQTTSILWLWILQIAWWLAAILPLALAAILIAAGFRWLHRRARALEQKPVKPGPGGFGKLLRDKFSHLALGQAMVYLIIGGLALGGMLGWFLQSRIQPAIHKAVEKGDVVKPELTPSPGQGDHLGFILFLALVVGVLTVYLAIRKYRSLCQRAAEMAAQLRGQHSPRPLLVRWFHDSKKMGLLVTMIGAWLAFGLLMQVVGLAVFFVPLPASLAKTSFEWATTAVIWVLVAMGALMFLAFFGPPVWMGLRHFKLDIRWYQENPTYRMIVNVGAVFGAGAFGTLLTMHLLNYLGRIFWPSIFH